MIKSVLIANRGEIAIRIARTARRMGIVTYAIRTRKEPEAVYLSSVDIVLDFPETDGNVPEFLDIDRLIYLAREHEIESLHPGYGYLSENAELAERCRENGIIFIGPSPEVIRLMSDKVAAKEIAERSGVPMLGASKGAIRDVDDARETADRLGYPVIIKAVSGGGGRGMRIVRKKSELAQLYKLAVAEAQVAFNDPSVFIEKYLESPKHIEFQILGDTHGNVIHLCDRECSVQRRHQKIVEESPSPFLTPELRERMGADAVAAARAVGYVGAGTIEFLVDKHRNYYFLEMNTRLQVEHPITEEVTGVDLVREQIRIAAGEPLSLAQPDIVQRGHAIECRVCAEDAAAGFMPSPGPVRQLSEPGGPGVRIDGYVYEGYDIPIHYDPMISKLIVHADTRERAIARMRRALDEYRITGVKTNIGYLSSILGVPDFERGSYDTSFLEKNAVLLGSAAPQQDERTEDLAMIVAYMNYIVDTESGAGATAATAGDQTSRWREFGKRKGVMGM